MRKHNEERIGAWRLLAKAGWSVQEIADLHGVPYQTVYAYVYVAGPPTAAGEKRPLRESRRSLAARAGLVGFGSGESWLGDD